MSSAGYAEPTMTLGTDPMHRNTTW
jgi:hypothetical protein